MITTTRDPFAVVTGASSGIGLELAKQFAQHGFDLIIAAEDDRIQTAAVDLRTLGHQVDAVKVDLAKHDGVELLCNRIESTERPLDAIAINAGVGIGGDFTRGTTLEDNLNIVDLNVRSSVHLAKRVLPTMVQRGMGRVLFTSSVAANMPGPFHSVYSASKAFLLSFSEALRNELKDTGVTVTALMPGATDTDFFRRAGMEDTKLGVSEKDDPADVAREGFEALMEGKDHVVTGSLKTKVQTAMARVLPSPAVAELNRKQSEPGSAHRDHD